MKFTFKPIFLFIVFGLYPYVKTLSQKTDYLEKKMEYFSKTDTINILSFYAKNQYYRAEYGRELINYKKDLFKEESCFYYDNVRYCNPYHIINYQLKKDSIIEIEFSGLTEIWTYKKINDTLFSISSHTNNLTEVGYAKSIIPFEKTGTFYTTNGKNDTVWTTIYQENYFPKIEPKFRQFDTVYGLKELDIAPKLLNGDTTYSKKVLGNVNKTLWSNTGGWKLFFFEFIIDEKGQISNIKALQQSDDVFYLKRGYEEIINLGIFSPGMKDGKPVNTKIMFTIEFSD